jgi:hypothetical protein
VVQDQPPLQLPEEPVLVHVALEAVGNVKAYLIGGNARYALPTSVPPGVYKVEASFDGDEPLLLIDLDVGVNDRPKVKCVASFRNCSRK